MHFEDQQQAMIALERYSTYNGLFFTEEGLLINTKSKHPLMVVSKAIEAMQFTIALAQVDNNIIALHGKHNVNAHALEMMGYKTVPVKAFLATTTTQIQKQIVRAFHWLNWDINSQFCGKCGAKLSSQMNATEKKCIPCGLSVFPKVSPAVMVLIYREKEILLARSWHFTPGMYSAIAGFIELGETAEEAAHREVKEELGIEITDLTYFGTQTWPFPDSFMIAFKAKYAKGELNIDTNEIEEALWFTKATLPTLPPSASISRKLIESVISSF